ncbi:MAG: short-chain dehydrogenase [Armatimonadetes bacterium 55-13]|nr:glucose 1-dehydrogenase [Armatimonadota bacterium]OJU62890.1 MAG: short-chain dehydrogenase [Armatimonadetes bacterium 55-13]
MNQNGRVSGKVALVTGASLGIGRACAKLLAAEGAAVAITDVRDEPGHSLVEEICQSGGTASYWHLDVADEDAVRATAKAVEAKFGAISILVNNAGISGVDKPTHEVTSEEWDRLMAVNVKGVFFCTKHVLPQMMKANKGSIINLSSIYGLVGAPDVPPYHASKGAVRLMTKTDALIYAPYGIRVNSIHPGFIWTPMVEGYLSSQSDQAAGRKALDALHPLGHVGEPDDIAYGVLYLGSDESKFITGTELVIDGGYTAR